MSSIIVNPRTWLEISFNLAFGIFMPMNGTFVELYEQTDGLYSQTNGLAMMRLFRGAVVVFGMVLFILFDGSLVLPRVSRRS